MGQTDSGPPAEIGSDDTQEIFRKSLEEIMEDVSEDEGSSDEEEPTPWDTLVHGPLEGPEPESESDEDYTSESESESGSEASLDSEEDEGEERAMPRTYSRQRTLLENWKLNPQEVFQASPDGDPGLAQEVMRAVFRAGGTQSGLPHWLGYTGKGRPDGLILEGVTRGKAGSAPTNTSGVTAHLIEFTRTSEAYWKESAEAKRIQHEKVVEALESAGIKTNLVIIQIRGACGRVGENIFWLDVSPSSSTE
jgi:hypothetical protein